MAGGQSVLSRSKGRGAILRTSSAAAPGAEASGLTCADYIIEIGKKQGVCLIGRKHCSPLETPKKK